MPGDETTVVHDPVCAIAGIVRGNVCDVGAKLWHRTVSDARKISRLFRRVRSRRAFVGGEYACLRVLFFQRRAQFPILDRMEREPSAVLRSTRRAFRWKTVLWFLQMDPFWRIFVVGCRCDLLRASLLGCGCRKRHHALVVRCEAVQKIVTRLHRHVSSLRLRPHAFTLPSPP